MTAIAVGLQVAGSAAGFAGQQSAANKYNGVAQQNAINANVAASRKYSDEQRRLTSEARQANTEGYNAAIKAKQARGTVLASAGTSGMDAGSISVNSILSGIENDDANNQYAVQNRHDDDRTNYSSNVQAYQAEAQGRINSMPYKDGPSALGLALSIGSSVLGGVSKSPQGQSMMGG